LDDLLKYLKKNKDIFDKEIKSIKCLSSMRIDSTYLAWVDFSKTGEPENTNYKKLINHAKIISKRGSTFGLGGYNHFRFNLATSTNLVKDSTERLRSVFK
jgi:cystathionine beta-lyase